MISNFALMALIVSDSHACFPYFFVLLLFSCRRCMSTVARKVLHNGMLWQIAIQRPKVRNAVDRETALLLKEAFLEFDRDATSRVAILYGEGGNFCAGADLQAIANGTSMNRVDALGPMGPTGLTLSKPVVAAVEGFCVAGGLELAVWCDLRVAAVTAKFGVFCRRFGVPLIDGGTVRLPRLIGQSRASDMILTGREVRADEAFQFGLVNRLVAEGQALTAAIQLAESMCDPPQTCMRNDRLSMLHQWGAKSLDDALRDELFVYGADSMNACNPADGAATFVASNAKRKSKT